MLICIFVSALVSLMVLGILDSLSIQADTVSAIERHEEAVYLADAGVQHAISALQSDPKSLGLNPPAVTKPAAVVLPSRPVATLRSQAFVRAPVSKPMSAELKWSDAGSAVSTGTRRGYVVGISVDEKGRATISSDGFVDDVRSRRTITVNNAFGMAGG